MLCEKCKQREATTHYVETINGNKRDASLFRVRQRRRS